MRYRDWPTLAPWLCLTKPAKMSPSMQGYFIKKGDYCVFTNYLCPDESEWESPNVFSPSHFLDKEGKFIKRCLHAIFCMSSGLSGRRPGEDGTLLFFSSLLQHFRFTPPPGVSEDELDLTPHVGFIVGP
ncbi:hypothetical protein LDENG_00257590 [Lucifuga dentata]|nr:hypothetical protein LDENG_00257590 [Lucifuga dentata]